MNMHEHDGALNEYQRSVLRERFLAEQYAAEEQERLANQEPFEWVYTEEGRDRDLERRLYGTRVEGQAEVSPNMIQQYLEEENLPVVPAYTEESRERDVEAQLFNENSAE